MKSESRATRQWGSVALMGGSMIVLGLSAFYVDVAAHFRFDFIEHHYEVFGLSILIGIIFAFIGCIGWARLYDRRGRAAMAGAIFLTPWALLLIGSPFVDMNVHGPSMITMMLVVPATVLAMVLLSMAATGRRTMR